MSRAVRNNGGNKLLASLPSEDAAYLQAVSRIVHPSRGRVLSSRAEPASEMWFPHSGSVALTATDATGRSVQTGLIGPEGCVGLEVAFDHAPALPDAVVQIAGPMSVVHSAQLRPALAARPSLQAALMRFLCGLSVQAIRTIACNRMHSLLSRCCRWLLTMRDCASSNDLPLTQENLAILLGSGRPRINGLLATLENNGLIQRHRGRISLLERAELEALTCDCYRIVHHSSPII